MRSLCAAALVAFVVSCGVAVDRVAAAEWQAGGGEAWAELLQAAKKEGGVVVAGPPSLAKPFADAFKADTGITLRYLGGSFRDLRTRFNTEVKAGKPTIDVYLGGSSSLFLKNDGHLAPVKPMLILPNAADPGNWKGGSLYWLDIEGRYLLQPNEYASGRVIVNTDKIDAGTIKNWRDLLRPEFTGKIASHDPRIPGAGQAVGAYLLDTFDPDFVKQFYKGQDVQITHEGRQLVEWVVRGTYPIIVGAIASDIERYRDAGVQNLAILEMDDAPGYVVGGSAVAVTPKNSPNPKAAAIFQNWYVSSRGQQIYADVLQVPSRRTDVNNDASPDYVIPSPGKIYPNQYDEDWYLNIRQNLRKNILELLGG